MNDSDDLTVLITHDASEVVPMRNKDAVEKKLPTNPSRGGIEKSHFKLPFMNAYQKHPFISILRVLYREVALFRGSSQVEIRQLKQNLIQIMDNHTRLLSDQGIENTHIMIVRYMISTFIDDTLGHMPWQQNITWADNSLLHYYYQETYGGEKFFKLLEQFTKEPNKYIQHIELAYVCISLGYEGRFALEKGTRGKVEIEQIRNELYAHMRTYSNNEEKFYQGHPVSDKKHNVTLHVPYKMFILGGLLLMGIVYGVFSSTVSSNEESLYNTIHLPQEESK